MTTLFQNLHFFAGAVLVVIGAPVFYYLVGLPIALSIKRVEWSMLLGVALIGVTGELAYMFGLSALRLTLIVGCSAIILAFSRLKFRLLQEGKINFAKEIRLNAESYLIAMLAVSTVPFALPGAWGGDWFLALESGRYLVEAKLFSSELLARPPLFGAASIPLCAFGDRLASFQVFCAIGSACALQVTRSFLGSAAHRYSLWLFGGSIFFLHLTANAWPKFLASAFVIASWLSVQERGRIQPLRTGCLLGLAIATHQSSILFAPLVLARLWGETSLRSFFTRAFTIGVMALVIFAPWELYTIETYGLAAKIRANPSISMRLENLPIGLNSLLVGLSTIVAWGPLTVLWHWATVESPLSPARIQKELFWLLTSGLNSLAASLAGILVPWLAGFKWKDLVAAFRQHARTISPVSKLALVLSFLGQVLLNPYFSPDGSLQTGWVPVGVGFIAVLAAWLSRLPSNDQARAIRSTVFFALVPWAFFNFLLTAGLVFSTNLKMAVSVSEGDLTLIADAGLKSLGMSAFPWIQIFVVGSLAALYAQKAPVSVLARSYDAALTDPNPS